MGKIPINLPPVIRDGGVMEQYTRTMRECIQRLRDGQPEVKRRPASAARATGSLTPFKIVPILVEEEGTEKRHIQVVYGPLFVPKLTTDNTGVATMYMETEVPVLSGPSNFMVGDPNQDPEEAPWGSLNVDTEGEWGVWLEIGWTKGVNTQSSPTPGGGFGAIALHSGTDGATVTVSSTDTAQSAAATIVGANSSICPVMIGVVKTPAEGISTVFKQYLTSSVIAPTLATNESFISSDNDPAQLLQIGSDGLLYVPTP